MSKGLIVLVIQFVVLIFNNSLALTTLDNLILGSLKEQYQEREDPLASVFDSSNLKAKDREKRQLAIYRGFFNEGTNLNGYCAHSQKIYFGTSWEYAQFKRGIVATLQYIGLDYTIRAIAKYAKKQEFTRSEYSNLVNNITGNYCSKNISIISVKEIKNNLLIKFTGDNSYQLPSIKDNTLFPLKLRDQVEKESAIQQGFLKTIELFKVFCSWGSDVDNLRLMPFLLRNPVVMSYVFRNMRGKRLEWNFKREEIYLTKSKNSAHVLCDNLICRRRKLDYFARKVPKSIGRKGLDSDLQRLYCSDLRDSDFKYKRQNKEVKNWINQLTFDEQNLQVAQFISLITGVPDFLVTGERYTDGKEVLRASLDDAWNKWSDKLIENFKTDLYFEESMTIEKVDRAHYFDIYRGNLKVVFDVNMGEFDRFVQKTGKISTQFSVKVSKKFLKWARKKWKNIDPRRERKNQSKKKIVDVFKKHIEDDVKMARDRYLVPPWNGDLSRLISLELLGQLDRYRGIKFNSKVEGFVRIPIEINYAPFALKYIRYLHKIEKSIKVQKRIDKLYAQKISNKT